MENLEESELITGTTKEDKVMLDYAKELINLKSSSSKVLSRMRVLKSALKPYVRDQPMKLLNGTIFYIDSSSASYVKKEKLKKVLIDTFHIKQEVADRIIEMGAAKKIINSYVKITTE